MGQTDINSSNSLQEPVVTACAACETIPEDVLILTCEHNLCLPCAAANLHQSQQRAENSTFQSVICDECGVATVLDPASATELISLHMDLQQHI